MKFIIYIRFNAYKFTVYFSISYYALRFSFYIYVINENLFSKTVKLFYAVIRQGAALPCNKSRQLFYSPHGGFHHPWLSNELLQFKTGVALAYMYVCGK